MASREHGWDFYWAKYNGIMGVLSNGEDLLIALLCKNRVSDMDAGGSAETQGCSRKQLAVFAALCKADSRSGESEYSTLGAH
jgi:hypothetical protein